MKKIIFPGKEQKNISKVLLKRKRKLKRLAVLCVLLVVTYIYGFGDYGIYQYYQLFQEEKRLQLKFEQLKSEALELEKEKQLLQKQDPEYLQRIAREKIGLAKPGEKIYKLVPLNSNR